MKQRRLKETPLGSVRHNHEANSAPVDNSLSLSLSLSLSNSLLKNSSHSHLSSILRRPCGFSFSLRKNKGSFLRRSSTFLKFIPVCSALLLILLSLTVFPLAHETNYTEATSGTASETMLTLSSSNVSLSLTPSTTGTFSSSTTAEQSTVSVTTTNYTGYTLKLASTGTGDASSRLTNNSDNTKYLSSISSALSSSAFNNATYNNKWGYLPSKYNSTTNTSYRPAPSTSGDTLDKTTTANSSANTYTIALGARADLTNPAGDYSNTFIITATANPIAYAITYNGSADGVTNLPENQASSSFSGTEVTLSSGVPIRNSYDFIGWCTVATTTDNCSDGALYQPGDKFPINQTTQNIVTLYATWKSKGITLTFNANGGTFAGGATTNVMTYSVPEVISYTQDTKTTSTTTTADGSGTLKSGIDDGSQYAGSSNYYKDIILNTDAPAPYDLTIYYATEGVGYDYICVFEGTSYTPSSGDGCTNAAARAPETNTGGTTSGNKIGGPGSGKTAYAATATYKLNNKTARIYFKSDGSVNSYGFWAEFTGGGDFLTQNLISGTYIDKPADRTGYAFLGWATTPNATTPDYTYDSNAYVMANTTAYAVWVQAKSFKETFANAGKSKVAGTDYYAMQDMTSSICAAVQPNSIGLSAQLIDTRDNKLYWVSKLLDGNCWMTQNLDYDIKAGENTVATLDGGTTTWSPNTATSTSIFSDSSATGTYSYDPGSKYLPNGTGSPTNITCTAASNGGDNCHYHLGNYYQWNAATAGSGGSITDADATASICPKGWRLPTSNSTTANYSFGKLTTAYSIPSNSDANLLKSPLWFVRAGSVFSGDLGNQGSVGYVWSSRALSFSYFAYFLGFNSSYANPSYNGGRDYGCSVRCVAE